MPKRKRLDYAGTAATQGSDHSKKAKLFRPDVERPQKSSRSLDAQRVLPSKTPASENSNPFQRGPNQDDLSLEPPTGLTKGQRKRWRKRQRRQAGTESAGRSLPTIVARSHIPPKDSRPAVQATTSAKRSRERRSNYSMLGRFAITKLIPRPQKHWRQDSGGAEVAGTVQAHGLRVDDEGIEFTKTGEDSSSGLAKVHQRRPKVSKDLQSETVEPKERLTSTLEDQVINQRSVSEPTEDSSDSQSRSNDSESDESSAAALPPPRKEPTGPARMGTRMVPTATHLEDLKSGLGPSRSIEAISRASFRSSRPSFGHKANSVPSYSNDLDAATAFKRFSAFLKGSAADSSEESSEEEGDSESDDADTEVAQRPAERLEMDESIENAVAASARSENVEAAQPADPALTHTISTAEAAQNEETDHLPMFSRLAPPEQPPSTDTEHATTTQRPATAATYPANVRVKRYTSFLGREPGGTGFGSGLTLEEPQTGDKGSRHQSSAAFPPGEPSSVLEDETDDVLMRTIAEVTGNVFASITPLPASKPLFSSDNPEKDGEPGVLTCVPGDRRMTRSMRKTKSTPKEKPTEIIITAQQSPVLAYNVHVPETRHEAIPEPVEATPVPLDDSSASENIDVAIDRPGDKRIDILDSSSSLSELGRTPSPPLKTVTGEFEFQDPRLTCPAPQYEDSITAAAVSKARSPPKKKRKMTGRTSKHFTPEKQSRRTRTSSKIESVSVEETDAQRKNGETPAGLDKQESEKRLATPRSTRSAKEQDTENSKHDGTRNKSEPVTPQKRTRRMRTTPNDKGNSKDDIDAQRDSGEVFAEVTKEEIQGPEEPSSTARSTRTSTKEDTEKPKRKGTGKRSAYFTPTKPKPDLDPNLIDRVDFYNSTGKKKRVPAGTSTAPVPPTTSHRFGIIQEKLWREPFWLLIAVTFLNKTAGRAAAPIFWTLKERYPTPELLAEARQEDLHKMIYHLGLQTQRSRRLIQIAQAWVEAPPAKGRRFRTLHYPVRGDGRAYKASEAMEEDADECAGALEIGHVTGCGPYAWDSWRIFCRDTLRDLADDYNGKNARSKSKFFVPEWKKVLPLDKELRACLRWMWLREGWIWGHDTGEKRRATAEEMRKAVQGEMDIADPQERKFAAQAAGVELLGEGEKTSAGGAVEMDANELKAKPAKEDNKAAPEERVQTHEVEAGDDDISDNIVVSPAQRKPSRRSARLTT